MSLFDPEGEFASRIAVIEAANKPKQASHLPTDSEERKHIPLTSGVLDYFPAALAAVAWVSWVGNEKHNPGQPLHHARGKSMDHADCITRHLTQRGTEDVVTLKDGRVFKVLHSAEVAWRALALLQEECEAAGAPIARAARPAQPDIRPLGELLEDIEHLHGTAHSYGGTR